MNDRNNMNSINKQRGEVGFIEIMIVAAIAGIIMSISLPVINGNFYMESKGITAEDIKSRIVKCEETLPRNKKCVVKIVVESE